VVIVYIELPVVVGQVKSWQGADAPCHFSPVAVDRRQFNARITFFFCFSHAIVRRRKVAMRKGKGKYMCIDGRNFFHHPNDGTIRKKSLFIKTKKGGNLFPMMAEDSVPWSLTD
jgi:hypothetical protein